MLSETLEDSKLSHTDCCERDNTGASVCSLREAGAGVGLDAQGLYWRGCLYRLLGGGSEWVRESLRIEASLTPVEGVRSRKQLGGRVSGSWLEVEWGGHSRAKMHNTCSDIAAAVTGWMQSGEAFWQTARRSQRFCIRRCLSVWQVPLNGRTCGRSF